MLRFFLVLIFSLLTSICYAADIYTVQDNSTAKYLRPESISATVLPKNEQDSQFEMTYTVISIPDKTVLDKLRREAGDNNIAYRKQTFTFRSSFNKSSNQWNTDGTLWLLDDELWGNSPEKCLYESHGKIPAGPYYGDEPVAVINRTIVITGYNYVVEHNLINFLNNSK